MKIKLFSKRTFLSFSFSIALLITFVVSMGCGNTRINNEQSVGKQLADLEESYKSGIINQKEYERLKRAIINKND